MDRHDLYKVSKRDIWPFLVNWADILPWPMETLSRALTVSSLTNQIRMFAELTITEHGKRRIRIHASAHVRTSDPLGDTMQPG